MNGIRTREPRPVVDGAAAAPRSDSRAYGAVLRQRPLRHADRSAGAARPRARLPLVSRLLLPPQVRRARSGGEWRRVMDALSVQETYFWREIDQIQGLACTVLPALAARHDRSTDPHLERAVRDRRRAADDCHGAQRGRLVRACADRRSTPAMRAAPPSTRRRRPLPRTIAFAPCRWPCARSTSSPRTARGSRSRRSGSGLPRGASSISLAPDEIAPYATSPIIFCRNAFIYFSPASVRAVVDALADRMPVPAYLFVGASESLLNVTDRFMLDDLEQRLCLRQTVSVRTDV